MGDDALSSRPPLLYGRKADSLTSTTAATAVEVSPTAQTGLDSFRCVRADDSVDTVAAGIDKKINADIVNLLAKGRKIGIIGTYLVKLFHQFLRKAKELRIDNDIVPYTNIRDRPVAGFAEVGEIVSQSQEVLMLAVAHGVFHCGGVHGMVKVVNDFRVVLRPLLQFVWLYDTVLILGLRQNVEQVVAEIVVRSRWDKTAQAVKREVYYQTMTMESRKDMRVSSWKKN